MKTSIIATVILFLLASVTYASPLNFRKAGKINYVKVIRINPNNVNTWSCSRQLSKSMHPYTNNPTLKQTKFDYTRAYKRPQPKELVPKPISFTNQIFNPRRSIWAR